MQHVDELRHLDGVRANFAVSESEYNANVILQQERPLVQTIFSNVRAFVEQQQYLFETSWDRGIVAEKRIKEIEEGFAEPIETKVIEGEDSCVKAIKEMYELSSDLSICCVAEGMQLAYDKFYEDFKQMINRKTNGTHQGVRWLTTISRDNINLIKRFLDLGLEIRHLNQLTILNFAISKKVLNATIEKLEAGKMIQSMITSNEPAYLKHFMFIFEELWKNSIDARGQIRNLEEGHELANVYVIPNPEESLRKAWTLIGSAKQEVLLLFATASAFRRQVQMGGLQVLLQTIQENHATVRILIPDDESAAHLVAQINRLLPEDSIRVMDGSLKTSITAVIIDRKHLMMFELKDDTKETSYEAVGLALYLDGRTLSLSYSSLFDNLWKQTQLYQKLEVHDKMQKEFVNIAAHELRTPIQPILGLSEILQDFVNKEPERAYVEIILRNARRLEKLTEDLLDVTRIEGHSLNLNKESFDLKDVILDQIRDFQNHVENNNIKILYDHKQAIVRADKARIMQVIANLLRNAITFTEQGGLISITTDVKSDEVIISVKDTGSGISQEMYPKLFTKFATKSEKGTGLGLFISKSIIEAHGGRIWAENNKDNKGSTFSFTLPVARKLKM
jgi:two-component system sensor histidine kinase VicK